MEDINLFIHAGTTSRIQTHHMPVPEHRQLQTNGSHDQYRAPPAWYSIKNSIPTNHEKPLKVDGPDTRQDTHDLLVCISSTGYDQIIPAWHAVRAPVWVIGGITCVFVDMRRNARHAFTDWRLLQYESAGLSPTMPARMPAMGILHNRKPPVMSSTHPNLCYGAMTLLWPYLYASDSGPERQR